ncbi:MAG: hypothetical protein WKF91_03195, partial [Segetibacter sp.]
MPDPIQDIKKGISDSEIKKKYKLTDDDIYTLHKFDYVTSEGGISQEKALEMYPDVGKYLGNVAAKITKTETKSPVTATKSPFREIKGSVLPDMNLGRPASDNTKVAPVETLKTQAEVDEENAPGNELGYNLMQSQGQQKIAKSTCVPASMSNVKPITQKEFQENDISIAPLSQQQKRELKNQEEADIFYETPQGKSYYNFVQSFWKPLVEGGAGIVAGGLRGAHQVAKVIGIDDGDKSDKIADTIVDYFNFGQRSKQSRSDAALYATPTKLQGGLINDGKINTEKLIPSTIENLTNMAVLLAGGQAMGGGKAGLMASSYLNTVEDYRTEGKKAGLEGGQLDAFSNMASGFSSTLEILSPNNPIIGQFKTRLLKEATKDIAAGVSVSTAVKRISKEFLKENGKEVVQELSQGAADHVSKAGFGIDEPMTYGSIRDEIAETVLMTVLPTSLLMGPNTLRHYKPSSQVLSSMNYAAQNKGEFNKGIDKAVTEGTYTPEQAQTMMDNIGMYSTKVKQLAGMGYSPDQSAKIAYAAYKDGKVSQNASAIADSPVLKATIGEEVKKDQEEIKNEIKDTALGIPEVGTEISGNDLVEIVKNTPNTGNALVDKVKDGNFRVEEIDLGQKYNDDPAFQLAVENHESTGEDPE